MRRGMHYDSLQNQLVGITGICIHIAMILFQLLGIEFSHRMIYIHRQLCLIKNNSKQLTFLRMKVLCMLQIWEKVWRIRKYSARRCTPAHGSTVNILRNILHCWSSGYLQEEANLYYFITNKAKTETSSLCLDQLRSMHVKPNSCQESQTATDYPRFCNIKRVGDSISSPLPNPPNPSPLCPKCQDPSKH